MRAAALLLGAVSIAHLIGQLAGRDALADSTQLLLMPAVAAVLLTGTRAPRGRLAHLALAALSFSWLGDAAPRLVSGDGAFLAMVGFFLIAQVVYAVAFWPHRRDSVLSRPRWLAPYLVVLVTIVAACAPAAGGLLVPVAVYAVAITVMAVLATGLGPRAGIGAAVFVVSDALIALDAFGVLTPPGGGFWVMSTYIVAQVLLMDAVRRRSGQRAVAGPAGDRSRDA